MSSPPLRTPTTKRHTSSMDTTIVNNATPKAAKETSRTSSAARVSASTRLPSQEDRNRAVKEANNCLEAMSHEGFQLDGFNLLSVVANPRSGMVGGSPSSFFPQPQQQAQDSSSSPLHQQPSQQPQHLAGTAISASAAAAAAAAAAVTSGDEPAPDMFSDAVHTIEYTLAQVTEQIETLNLFLEELSRQYLGDDAGGESLFLEYYYQDMGEENAAVSASVVGVPPQLANLQQLQDLQSYLEECGVLAHSLFALGLETRTTTYTADGEPENAINREELDEQLKDMPSVFFDTEFDLTDSLTFMELLLRSDELDTMDGNATTTASTKDYNSRRATNSLYQPTYELVPVREPDSLAGYLDRVELALQEQVRDKSTAFFHETTRFGQLQSNIDDLLQQAQVVRTHLQQALSVYRQSKDISNYQRQDYERLVVLLENTMELIRCKASIGGLLSASDHLGAAQQIQYGRRLLQGGDADGSGSVALATIAEEVSSGEGSVKVATSSLEDTLKLQHMTALSTCGAQFGQYEALVIQSLSEELVEIFFNWRPNEKERVQDMVQALQLCKAMDKLSELYQRRMQQTIRMTVRTTIAEFVESSGSTGGSGGVTGMSQPAFFSCLQLLIEEMQSILRMAHKVDEFCVAESIFEEKEQEQQQQRWTTEAVTQGAELAAKSIAELLRLRKEAHSLISLVEMRQLWDTCLSFTTVVEGYGNNARAVSLRSTLVGQAKSFVDRTHESNMSALVAALDSERWSQCEVSAERQTALTRLCTGLATVPAQFRNYQEDDDGKASNEKKPTAIVEGVNYKVVWSCLLLVEMIMTNLSSAAHFQSLAPNCVTKCVELLRLFNARATNLVLGAGAIHSAARLKSINAKHLSYVTQCLGMIMALLPHIRAALMAQLPPKQHSLLADLDKIKKEYQDHNERVLNKFVSIIGGIVEHGLAPRIANTDFDARARELPFEKLEDIQCCVFLEGISNSTTKLHQVLSSLLPPDHLQDVFSRIFAYLDQKTPALFVSASATSNPQNALPAFHFPLTDEGKRRMVLEVAYTTKTLNALSGVHPWDFTAMTVLGRKVDYILPDEGLGSCTTNEDPGDTPFNEQTEANRTAANMTPPETESIGSSNEHDEEIAADGENDENGEAFREAERPVAANGGGPSPTATIGEEPVANGCTPSPTATINGDSGPHGKRTEIPVNTANREEQSSELAGT